MGIGRQLNWEKFFLKIVNSFGFLLKLKLSIYGSVQIGPLQCPQLGQIEKPLWVLDEHFKGACLRKKEWRGWSFASVP